MPMVIGHAGLGRERRACGVRANSRWSGSGESTCSLPPSRMPVPASAITPTSSHSSSHAASRDATGRSSDVSWCSLRDVVSPIAPAAQRVGELSLHQREVVVGRLLLEGALPHRPRAQRRVPDVGRVVDRLRAGDRPRRGTRGTSPSSIRATPAPTGSMSSARSRLRTTSARASSRTGASVNPQLPITAVVTPCQHEFAPCGSQNTWASMWVWPSMKPGRHHVALGVDLLVARARGSARPARSRRRRSPTSAR